MRFWDFPASRDVEQTAERIRQSRGLDPRWHAAWAILPRSGGSSIGMINYHRREPWNQRLELGWILARSFWGQGLMNEAARPVLDDCFTRLETHRIEAHIEPGNAASRTLAVKLGFVQETGPLRDRQRVHGEFRSILIYAMLRTDWPAASPVAVG
jgi:ribosomal-protein-alanine N-acetyltransferase